MARASGTNTDKGQETELRRGIIFILTSPSGGGKTSICKRILAADERIRFSVSFTSRKSRAGELDGTDYFFIDEEEFRAKIRREDFLEWATVHGHLYGTDRKRTEESIEQGCDVLMDIDIQGADSVKRAVSDCVRVFVLPPSREEMMKRLRDRGTDSPEELERRINIAATEIERWRDFDYKVVNDDLDAAVRDVQAIIAAERLSLRHSQQDVEAILRSFGLSV